MTADSFFQKQEKESAVVMPEIVTRDIRIRPDRQAGIGGNSHGVSY